MVETIKQSASKMISGLWWLWVVQAIISIVFGTLAIFWPGLTLVSLVQLLAVFVLVIGVTEIVRAIVSITDRNTWWMTLVVGILTLAAGIYLARNPAVSFATFVLTVGGSFIIWGAIEVVQSFLDIFPTSQRVMTFLAGFAGVLAGVVTLLQPESGGIAFVWALGFFAFVNGITALVVAIEQHDSYSMLRSALKSELK